MSSLSGSGSCFGVRKFGEPPRKQGSPEWVHIALEEGFHPFEKYKLLSRVQLFVTHGLYSPWNSPGRNTGVGSLSFLQGIFLTQELNLGLLHCRQILYQLSHQGRPSSLRHTFFFTNHPTLSHPLSCRSQVEVLFSGPNQYTSPGCMSVPVTAPSSDHGAQTPLGPFRALGLGKPRPVAFAGTGAGLSPRPLSCPGPVCLVSLQGRVS